MMLTIAQTGDARENAASEIDLALSLLASNKAADLVETTALSLPSGEWTRVAAMASSQWAWFLAMTVILLLARARQRTCRSFADAYNRTVLGFFVTPHNSGYLALALTASFSILALLILSFFWRSRNIQKDLELIESLNQAGG